MPELESVRATSPGSGQLELMADQGSVTLLPGAKQQLTLTLRNTSGTLMTVDLIIIGPPSQWLSLSQSSIPLAPAQSARAILTCTATAGAPTGSYPLAITAQSREDPAVRAQLDLIFEIAEPGQVIVELSPTQAAGQSSAEFQIQVSQSGSTPLHVNLSAGGDQTTCNYTFNPAALEVMPSQTARSRLTVSARQALNGADMRAYPFTVMATTSEGATAMASAHGQFVQQRLPPLTMRLNPARASGPGPVSLLVQIENPSQVATTFHLSGADSDGACRYQFEPPGITAPPGGSAQATLTITPLHYHSDAADKIHNFSIRAAPTEGLISPLQAESVFIQSGVEQPVVHLTPTSQSSSRPAAFTVDVSNPRAMPAQVEILPSSTDGMCELAVNPSRLSLAPHGRATARLNVRPVSKLLPGESRRTCSFTVQARATDLSDPVQVQGSLVQVPGVPILRWLAIAAGALLALVVCGALLWFGSSALRSLGSQLPQVSELLPTPLPLVTPLPVPTDTATPAPAPPMTPSNAPTGGGGGGGQSKPTKTPTSPPPTIDPARYSQYNGNWGNDDPNTAGITRLQITNSGPTISVHAFHKCSPADCDWGTNSGKFTNEPFTIQFNPSSTDKERLTLSKQNNKLQVVDASTSDGTSTSTFHTILFLPPILFSTATPVFKLKPPILQPIPPLVAP